MTLSIFLSNNNTYSNTFIRAENGYFYHDNLTLTNVVVNITQELDLDVKWLNLTNVTLVQPQHAILKIGHLVYQHLPKNSMWLLERPEAKPVQLKLHRYTSVITKNLYKALVVKAIILSILGVYYARKRGVLKASQ